MVVKKIKKLLIYLSLIVVLVFLFNLYAIMKIKTAEIDIQKQHVNSEDAYEEIKEKKYEISSKADLERLADLVNSGESFEEYTVQLNTNLSIDGKLVSIGNYQTPFQGNFEGNGYTISNFEICSDEQNIGLFGCVQRACISNLKVKNAVVQNGDGSGTGGIVGIALEGKIENCVFDGTVNAQSGSVGGIVGNNHSQILNCVVSGEIAGGTPGYYRLETGEEGNYGIGGIAGNNKWRIELCRNYGQIKSRNGVVEEGGGVSGWNSGEIVCCTNYGKSGSGGIVDCNDGVGRIVQCFNFGSASAGIATTSHQDGSIEECANLSNILGRYKGGVCSFWGMRDTAGGEGKIEKCIVEATSTKKIVNKENSKYEGKNYIVHELNDRQHSQIKSLINENKHIEAYNALIDFECNYRLKLTVRYSLIVVVICFVGTSVILGCEIIKNKKSYLKAMQLTENGEWNLAVAILLQTETCRKCKRQAEKLFLHHINKCDEKNEFSLGRTKEGEEILWDVLFKDECIVVLISKKILAKEIFDSRIEAVGWKDSELYKRLNSYYKQLWFHELELERLKNDITLLEINEAGYYFEKNSSRKCKIQKTVSGLLSDGEYGWWWLRRDETEESRKMPFVTQDGVISKMGMINNAKELGVRPVIVIKRKR